MFNAVTGSIEFILWIAFTLIKAAAFIDCLRWRKDAYPAVGRQSKLLWGSSPVTWCTTVDPSSSWG